MPFCFEASRDHISNPGYNYDAAGDLLWDGGSNYEYDAEGRVKHSYSTGQWQYPMYNALGQRVQDYQGTDPMTLTYPADISGRRTGAFAQWPSQHWTGWNVYWARVAGQHISMGGADSWLAHADAIDSTTMVTDETGAWVWDQVFGPWGEIWQQTGTRPWFVFAGLRWPVNDPLYPSASREYSEGMARWMTPDPDSAGADVANPQSWNMYGYAGNNPVTNTDPGGLDCAYLSSGGTSIKSIDQTISQEGCEKNGGYYVQGTITDFSIQNDKYEFTSLTGANSEPITTTFQEAPGAISPDLGPLDLLLMFTGATEGADLAEGAGEIGEGLTGDLARIARGGIGPVLKGRAGVERAVAEVEAEGGKVLGREVTIETAAGRARVDFVYEDAGGRIHLAEAKNGPTARLNPNQKAVYTEFEASGGRLVGGNARGVPSTNLPPTAVRIFKY